MFALRPKKHIHAHTIKTKIEQVCQCKCTRVDSNQKWINMWLIRSIGIMCNIMGKWMFSDIGLGHVPTWLHFNTLPRCCYVGPTANKVSLDWRITIGWRRWCNWRLVSLGYDTVASIRPSLHSPTLTYYHSYPHTYHWHCLILTLTTGIILKLRTHVNQAMHSNIFKYFYCRRLILTLTILYLLTTYFNHLILLILSLT